MNNEPNKGGFMRFHHNNIGKHLVKCVIVAVLLVGEFG